MVIMRFKGGLGNQMFQYALYRSMEEKGMEVKAEISSYDFDKKRKFQLDKFPNIKLNILGKDVYEKLEAGYCNRSLLKRVLDKLFPRKNFYYRERDEEHFNACLYTFKNKIVDGYFQNLQYFLNYEDILRKELRFPQCEEEHLKRLYIELMEHEDTASIHIRRGDYLELAQFYGDICTLEYYKNAINYLNGLYGSLQYYIFSDDIEWAEQNLEIENAIYISKEMFGTYEDWYDMYLMSLCHHNIIANSSFSWWGAWLNQHKDKIVIRPKKWNQKSDMKGLICENWRCI